VTYDLDTQNSSLPPLRGRDRPRLEPLVLPMASRPFSRQVVHA